VGLVEQSGASRCNRCGGRCLSRLPAHLSCRRDSSESATSTSLQTGSGSTSAPAQAHLHGTGAKGGRPTATGGWVGMRLRGQLAGIRCGTCAERTGSHSSPCACRQVMAEPGRQSGPAGERGAPMSTATPPQPSRNATKASGMPTAHSASTAGVCFSGTFSFLAGRASLSPPPVLLPLRVRTMARSRLPAKEVSAVSGGVGESARYDGNDV
jgi:hypothetical protein